MGGYNYFLTGELDQRQIDKAKSQKGFFNKLLEKIFNPEGGVYIEITSVEFQQMKQALLEDLTTYLKQRIPAPLPASEFPLISFEGSPVYLRGESESKHDPLIWILLIRFSGCTGLCEESAALSIHWADIWMQDRFDEIKETIFEPFGFKADDLPLFESAKTFLPVENGQHYASYLIEDYLLEPDDNPFDLDAGFREEMSDESWEAKLSDIWQDYGELMSDDQCRCQLCAPNFLKSVTPSK